MSSARGKLSGTSCTPYDRLHRESRQVEFPISQELATDLILQSLPDSYSQFILNYNMNEISKSLPDLLNMLRTAEQSVNKGKGKTIMMVNRGKGKQVARNPKGKIKVFAKPKDASLKPTGGVSKGECYYYSTIGHGKSNFPKISRRQEAWNSDSIPLTYGIVAYVI